MKVKRICPLITAGILLLSCSGKDHLINKSRIGQIDEYPDSSFIGILKCLQFQDGKIFALDINRRSVIALNEDLSDYESISSGGKGPGELVDPFSFLVDGDSVHVMDFGAMKMKSFHDGDFCKETPFPAQARDNRFSKVNDSYFLPFNSKDVSVIRVNPNGEIVPFQRTDSFSSPVKTATMNSCHVLTYGDDLVILPEALPFVNIVDKSGTLLRTIDLRLSNTYKYNFAYSHRADQDEKKCIILNQDAYILDNMLFILIPDYDGQYECNRIISVNLETGIASKEMLVLEGSHYSSFCATKSRLYAFNARENQLEIFEI